MENARFDALIRQFSGHLSRRTLARAFALSGWALPTLVDARKKHKKRKKKIKRNDFDCVDTGRFCKKDSQCCSGVCSGKKNKKKCKSHDAQGCQPNQDTCLGVPFPCATSTGEVGRCVVTTGKAGYCFTPLSGGLCFNCQKDADCEPFCGPQAACIVCATDCVGESLNNTACVGVATASCDFGP